MNHDPPKYTLEDFDLIQFVAPDIHGLPRGKLLPQKIARSVFGRGTEHFACELSSVVGVDSDIPWGVPEFINSSFYNGILMPVAGTLTFLPWASTPRRRVGQVITDTLRVDGQIHPSSVRYQTEVLVKKLEILGFGLCSAFSCQFTAFKTGSDCTEYLGCGHGGPFSAYQTMEEEDQVIELCLSLRRAGVAVEAWAKVGAPDRFEMSLVPTEGLVTADMVFLLKSGLKTVLRKMGYDATFMTCPPSRGGKEHKHSFAAFPFRYKITSQDGQNGFVDTSKEDKMSDTCRAWVGGVLQHGAAITALCCPTVNCYSNLHHDATRPRTLCWGVDSSTAFLNVKVVDNAVWLEHRVVSSASNPYFVLLATLAAGLDGVDRGMTCPEKASPDAAPVPESLSSALDALQHDTVVKGALSPLLLKCFCWLKQEEISKFNKLEPRDDLGAKTEALEKELYFANL